LRLSGSLWAGPCALAFAGAPMSVALAQGEPEGESEQVTSVASAQSELPPEEEDGKKKAEILYAPAPFSSPTTGFGLAGGVVALYNPNGSPNQWVTGGGLAFTTRGTKAVAVFHRMSSASDHFRLSANANYSNQDIKFYGIGDADGDRNDPLPLDNKSFGIKANVTFRVASNFYAGVRYRLTTNNAVPDEHLEEGEVPSLTPPPPADELKSTLSMIGPSIEYDTRDNHDQPRSGIDLMAAWLFGFDELLDSYDHDKLMAEAHGYFSISESAIVAVSAAGCSASGEVPYYDLCLFGASADLRGYDTGRYRDRASWALQGEYRRQFSTRWGGVVFAGVGGIAPSVGDIFDGNMLPSGGVGVRYRPFKDNDMQLRLDAAIGKDDHGIYLGLGEAF